MWEAVQLEMGRRKKYVLKHRIQKLEYASDDNPFAGRVICGSCGHAYGRKVWNSTDDRLRRVVWQCSAKYEVKGKKGCESRHLDDGVLYQAFVGAFNAMIENKDCFLRKWQERLGSENALVRYKAKQLIGVITEAAMINKIDIDLYFAMVEKMTVFDDGRIIVSLLDGTDVECKME